MSRELQSIVTPLNANILWNELLLQWETLTRRFRGPEADKRFPELSTDSASYPSRKAVNLKIAHAFLETGRNKCRCWNIGNRKYGRSRGDWQFFQCGEEIPVAKLPTVKAMGPSLVIVGPEYMRDGERYVTVSLLPKHPWSKFRAFESLTAGVADQLEYVSAPGREDVLLGLIHGDPEEYCTALRRHAYFTANPVTYASSLEKVLENVERETDGLWEKWGEPT